MPLNVSIRARWNNQRGTLRSRLLEVLTIRPAD
jgi:hypothetical protein